MQTDFKLYKVDMKYIRNLHNINDKVKQIVKRFVIKRTSYIRNILQMSCLQVEIVALIFPG